MIKRILKHTFSLLNIDHVKLGPKWNYKNVISPYHRIYYIDEGEGEIFNMERIFKLESGYLYMIPSFTLCNLNCKSSLGQYFVQFFEESYEGVSLFASNRSIFKLKAKDIDIVNFKRLLEINPGRGINRSDDPKFYEKNVFYQEYQELNNYQSVSIFLETQGLLLQLVSRFTAPEFFNQKEIGFIPGNILTSIDFILTNLHLPLTVNSLAERANRNPEYFSRLFERYTGSRLSSYITQKRVERAQHLVVTSQMKYIQIAQQTGFDSLSHFSRTFKKSTGVTPREFRKMVHSMTY